MTECTKMIMMWNFLKFPGQYDGIQNQLSAIFSNVTVMKQMIDVITLFFKETETYLQLYWADYARIFQVSLIQNPTQFTDCDILKLITGDDQAIWEDYVGKDPDLLSIFATKLRTSKLREITPENCQKYNGEIFLGKWDNETKEHMTQYAIMRKQEIEVK